MDEVKSMRSIPQVKKMTYNW